MKLTTVYIDVINFSIIQMVYILLPVDFPVLHEQYLTRCSLGHMAPCVVVNIGIGYGLLSVRHYQNQCWLFCQINLKVHISSSIKNKGNASSLGYIKPEMYSTIRKRSMAGSRFWIRVYFPHSLLKLWLAQEGEQPLFALWWTIFSLSIHELHENDKIARESLSDHCTMRHIWREKCFPGDMWAQLKRGVLLTARFHPYFSWLLCQHSDNYMIQWIKPGRYDYHTIRC